ncbi:hypothetical protein C8R45DRAFT_1093742 [Mycena sanguinolenta]|nr:hypothetical protein C8R45DRAFT_1093742 [Mycena sanguinolenta]
MFSKLLAFGLGALAVVGAVPAVLSQKPLLSCSVNFETSVAPVESFAAIEPGEYMIYNEAFGKNPVRAYTPNFPAFVSLEDPGAFGIWWVEPSGYPGSNEYTMTNTGLHTQAKVRETVVVSTDGQGDSFAIWPAGEGTFTVPDEDKVWTVVPAGKRSPVYLRPQVGALAAKWRLVPLHRE